MHQPQSSTRRKTQKVTGVELIVADTHVDVTSPEFDLRFRSRDAFRRFRDFVETARIVGDDEMRPVQSELTDEWYVLAVGEGMIVVSYFTSDDVELAFTISEERWRELGQVVMDSTGNV